jgi:hypothetical protein
MKKTFILLSLVFFLVGQLSAQEILSKKNNKLHNQTQIQHPKSFNYAFTMTSGTYTELSDTISLNNGMPWDDPDYLILLPFPFTINGTNIVNELFFDGLGADLAAEVIPNELYEYILPFGCDVVDRGIGTTVSLSPISYKVEGSTPNRILKVQWQNAGAYGEGQPYNMYINFQLWLYETSNIIEFHYGPSMIDNPQIFYEDEDGAYIGIVSYDDVMLEMLNIHLLSGQASSPFLSALDGTITGTPSEGTIYRFVPNVTSVPYLTESYQLMIFPNPASDIIQVNIPSQESVSIRMTDMAGKTVFQQENSAKNIDISHISPGIYMLSFRTESGTYASKLIKQ